MATTVMNVRLDSETKKTFDRLARELNRPRGRLAARAIEEYVRRNAWQVAAIKEGISQLDAGQSVDVDEAMDELESIIAEEEAARAG